MDKLQQEVRVPVVTEAVYELCPNDPDMAPYFEIEDPSEQSRVMHRLLTDITRTIGGNDVLNGERILKKWSGPNAAPLMVPLVNGHPFVTETVAIDYLKERVRDVADAWGPEHVVKMSTASPCPNCVPRPPVHYVIRSVYITIDSSPAVGKSLTANGDRVRALIAIRMTAETVFNPSADHSGEHGTTADKLPPGATGDATHDHSGHSHSNRGSGSNVVLKPAKPRRGGGKPNKRGSPKKTGRKPDGH